MQPLDPRLLAVVVVLSVGAWASPADAQTAKLLNLTCKHTDAQGALFVAEIQTDAVASAGDFKIAQTDLSPPRRVAATRIVDYRHSDAPISFVFLIQGNEAWMGRSSYEPGDRMPAVHRALPPTIKPIIRDAPKGSQGSLIVYGGAAAMIKYPMGPLAGMAPALGAEKNYYDKLGVPLVPGLAAAISVLSQRATRRILMIIGDGSAQAPHNVQALHRQKRLLEKLHIETYAVRYATDKRNESRRKERLFGLASEPANAFQAHQAGNLGEISKKLHGRIANRQYVVFPTAGFELDGKSHEMQFVYKSEAPQNQRVDFCAARPKRVSAGNASKSAPAATKTKGGCGCATGNNDPVALVGLALLGLVFWRPRW